MTNKFEFSKSNLSHCALLIVLYLIENFNKEKLIKLEAKFLKSYFNYNSYNPIYKALKELENINLIRKTDKKHFYEVNFSMIPYKNKYKIEKTEEHINPDGSKIIEYYQLIIKKLS